MRYSTHMLYAYASSKSEKRVTVCEDEGKPGCWIIWIIMHYFMNLWIIWVLNGILGLSSVIHPTQTNLMDIDYMDGLPLQQVDDYDYITKVCYLLVEMLMTMFVTYVIDNGSLFL